MTTNALLSAERLEWSQRRLVKAKNTNFKVNAKNKSWGKIIFPKFKAQASEQSEREPPTILEVVLFRNWGSDIVWCEMGEAAR